jgi:NADH dehydrogenase FAD-containing subunit
MSSGQPTNNPIGNILLVEAAPTVLGPFPGDLKRDTQEQLENIDVQVPHTAAVAMDDDSFTIRGPRGRTGSHPHQDLSSPREMRTPIESAHR